MRTTQQRSSLTSRVLLLVAGPHDKASKVGPMRCTPVLAASSAIKARGQRDNPALLHDVTPESKNLGRHWGLLQWAVGPDLAAALIGCAF